MNAAAMGPELRPISGPAVWYGPEMARRTDWIRPLTAAEIAELEAAVQRLDATGIDIADIGPTDLQVPAPAAAGRQIRRAVLQETGFILVRGDTGASAGCPAMRHRLFRPRRHARRAGIAECMGHILGHVKDIGADYAQADASRLPDRGAAALPHRQFRYRRDCCA